MLIGLPVRLLALLPLLAAPPTLSHAAEWRLPPPGAAGWEPLTFPKVARHTRYTPLRIDGRAAVRAEADCSASALVYELNEFDLRAYPRLSWDWRVDVPLDLEHVRVKAGDDFAARVYVLFEYRPGRASVWERLRRSTLEVLLRIELPGNALNYVWTAAEPRGAIWPNPYTAASRMLSLGAGEPGRWRHEEVNVAGDYERAFSEPPPAAVAVALMSDSDDSCQKARAFFAGLHFGPRPVQ
ncbi:MAG: DUF3047 domain-containing protein [Myxococcota bacterium]